MEIVRSHYLLYETTERYIFIFIITDIIIDIQQTSS